MSTLTLVAAFLAVMLLGAFCLVSFLPEPVFVVAQSHPLSTRVKALETSEWAPLKRVSVFEMAVSTSDLVKAPIVIR